MFGEEHGGCMKIVPMTAVRVSSRAISFLIPVVGIVAAALRPDRRGSNGLPISESRPSRPNGESPNPYCIG